MFLKIRVPRAGVWITAAFLIAISPLSLMLFSDYSQETRGVFVALELPCDPGHMDVQVCVVPKLDDKEPILRAAMDDAVEARLRRVVILMKDGEIEGGLNLLAPLLNQGHPRAQFLASELYRRGGRSSAEQTSVDRTSKSRGITA